MKIILVVGARPNFMKIAPIIRAIKSFNQTNLSRLPCSESVRGEMRPALWSVETTTWGAYFTGTKKTYEHPQLVGFNLFNISRVFGWGGVG